jgi:hypothetical protein
MEKRQRKQRNRKNHNDQIRGVRSKNTQRGDKDNISQTHTKAKQWIVYQSEPEKTA